MIRPTVGRIVEYFPELHDPGGSNAGEPLPAMICKVHGDDCVNLMVSDANGVPFGRTSVKLVQEGKPQPGECGWMEYQRGQAKKTEELENRLTAEAGGAPR